MKEKMEVGLADAADNSNIVKLVVNRSFFEKARQSGRTKEGASALSYKECLDAFDFDGDGRLDEREFYQLLNELFSYKGVVDHLKLQKKREIFKCFDTNNDGKVDEDEMKLCWDILIKQAIFPVTALLVVDVQNDFISGTLALSQCPAEQDGEDVVHVINKLLESEKFDLVVYTKDWHPTNHCSFVDNISKFKIHESSEVKYDAKVLDKVVMEVENIGKYEQVMWPRHCQQDTWGAQIHKDLTIARNSITTYKGKNPCIDSYSAFWDNEKLNATGLVKDLIKNNVSDVFICGLAYDLCVGATAADALEHGFRTAIVDDACRGVSVEGIDKTRRELLEGSAVIVNSDEVGNMVSGVDRRAALGYHSAVHFATAANLARHDC